MSKIISSSIWSAHDIPNGISFDSNLGVFSGTPNVPAGEYVVPVSVSTNYGSDNKDVRFIIDEQANPVYAIGSQAARWSNNAEPDDYGFRKLDIPDASRLSTIPAGFAAKCKGGKWYLGSSSSLPIYGGNGKDKGKSYYSPDVFDVDDVINITGGKMNVANHGIYFAFQTHDETAVFGYSNASTGYTNTFKYYMDNIKLLHKDFAYGFSMVSYDNEIFASTINNVGINTKPIFSSDVPINKIITRIITNTFSYFFLNAEANLLEFSINNPYRSDTAAPEIILNNVSDIWMRYGNDQLYALLNNGQLFGRGNNTSYMLGHASNGEYFNDFVYLGDFDAKKIEAGFMLTRDGKLFHTGAAISGIAPACEGWCHIFPEYSFQDFSYIPGDASALGTKTLTAIIKE